MTFLPTLSQFYSNDFWIGFIVAIQVIVFGYFFLNKYKNKSTSSESVSANLFNTVINDEHNYRRFKTYSPPVPNTWYHIIDSDEIKSDGKVLYIRAIGQNFAIWRTSDGEPIAMNAYCPHMGANLGVGGKILLKDDCIQCPFHEWTFDKNGNLSDIPYIKDKEKLKRIPCKPIRKYICKDFAGLLCVYFHADMDTDPDTDDIASTPEFDLPEFITEELNNKSNGNNWHLHSNINIGHKPLSLIDWVDQAGDHGHFQTLHSHFLIPYTTKSFPLWLTNLLPLSISHKCTTIIGNKWNSKLHGKKGKYYGHNCKQYIYFLDTAGVKWNNKLIQSTQSLTKEFYIGPAIMIFHIPLKEMGIGDIKIIVTTTPVLNNNNNGYSNGSIMRVRVWLSDYSFKLRIISWFIVGIAVSQLLSDIKIMCNKIRLKKPCITSGCGPYNIVNTWLKSFYSKSSGNVGKHNLDDW